MRLAIERHRPGGVDAPVEVELADGFDAMPGVPPLHRVRAAAERLLGGPVWVLRFRAGPPLVAEVCAWDTLPDLPDRGLRAAWAAPGWRADLTAWLTDRVGPHRLEQVRVWGRSTVLRVDAAGGPLWLKQSYGLPIGEGAALTFVAAAGTLDTPALVDAEGARALMHPLAGRPMVDAPLDAWAAGIRALVAFQQQADPAPWVAAGARDLRGRDWAARLRRLLADHGQDPDHAGAVAEPFAALASVPAGVLPHDMGPWNLRWRDPGVQAFDWADVVIGPLPFLLDRYLSECDTDERRAAVTAAWTDAWGAGADEAWQATRRCALLLEACRYDDELAWLDPDTPIARALRAGIGRQLRRQLERLDLTASS